MYTPERRHTVRNLQHHVILIIAAVIATVSSAPNVAIAQFEGNIELLRTVAATYKANRQAIQTWQAEARIHSIWEVGDSHHQERIDVVSFAYSQAQGASRWNIRTVQGRLTLPDQNEEDPGAAGYRAGMLKEDRYYAYEVFDFQAENAPPRLLINERREATRDMISDAGFDPMFHLTLGGESVDRRLLFLYENAHNPKMSGHYVITRDGSRVQVKATSPGRDKESVNASVYDLSKGGNRVEFHHSSDDIVSDWEYTYERHDGAWVLKSLTRDDTSREHGPGEDADPIVTTRKKSIEWTTNVINEPLAPDTFSLARLGVRPGDTVLDYIASIRFPYVQGMKIEGARGKALAPRRRSRPIRMRP